VEKLLTEFSKDKSHKDGYRSQCKACEKVYAKEWYVANRERKPDSINKPRYSEEQKARALALYKTGLTAEEVQQECDVGAKTVVRVARAAGCPKHSAAKRLREKRGKDASNWRGGISTTYDPNANNRYALVNACKRHGITVDDYNAMFEEQNGCCAICLRPRCSMNKRLGIDHDHRTGQVRGLLCGECNLILGKIEKQEVPLESFYQYLDERSP